MTYAFERNGLLVIFISLFVVSLFRVSLDQCSVTKTIEAVYGMEGVLMCSCAIARSS